MRFLLQFYYSPKKKKKHKFIYLFFPLFKGPIMSVSVMAGRLKKKIYVYSYLHKLNKFCKDTYY